MYVEQVFRKQRRSKLLFASSMLTLSLLFGALEHPVSIGSLHPLVRASGAIQHKNHKWANQIDFSPSCFAIGEHSNPDETVKSISHFIWNCLIIGLFIGIDFLKSGPSAIG